MNIALAGLSALALAACGKNANLAGEWIQPVPGMPQMTQGFTLKEDGSASSINMATLKYESWKEENGKLILTGKSIGNSQTIAFADTFEIEKLTDNSFRDSVPAPDCTAGGFCCVTSLAGGMESTPAECAARHIFNRRTLQGGAFLYLCSNIWLMTA